VLTLGLGLYTKSKLNDISLKKIKVNGCIKLKFEVTFSKPYFKYAETQNKLHTHLSSIQLISV